MRPNATADALAMYARLAYTALFERTRIVAGGSVTPVPYATLTGVLGAGGPVSFSLPNDTAASVAPGAGFKFAHHVGFINMDGGGTITISAPDGKTINGASSLVIPASAGAFALCFFDISSGGSWVALVSGVGGSVAPPITSTTTVGPGTISMSTAAGGAPLVTSPAITTVAGQKVMATVSMEIDSEGGLAAIATLTMRQDGVIIDTAVQSVAASASEVASWTWETTPAPGSHVFSVNGQSSVAAALAVGAISVRLTTVTLPG